MFRNYILIALRSAWRNKAYFLINLFGLAIGIASSLMILLFVLDELSFDRHNEHYNEIYRINIRGKIQGSEIEAALSCAPIGAALREEIPEVEAFTRLFTFDGDPVVRFGDRVFIEEDFLYVDSSFLDVFTAPLKAGNPEDLLRRPNTVVLSAETARRFFGDKDPVGEQLLVGTRRTPFEVTGVVEGFPENSHFHFSMLGSMTSLYLASATNWLGNNNYTYIRLTPGSDPSEVETKFPEMIARNMGPELESILGLTIDEFYDAGNKYGYFLQPLQDIHLKSDLQFEIDPGGSWASVVIFSVIAIFLIIIASINFMNLATASATRRATEVGIRKAAGADKNQLIRQFITESFLIVLLALILSVVLVELAMPGFNRLAGKSLTLLSLGVGPLVSGLILIGLFVGFLSGAYPAFFLSSFKPVCVLKSGSMRGIRGAGLRKVLVTFQFTVTIILFICTLVVNRQMMHIRVSDLGFEKENLVVVDRVHVLGSQIEAFREELLKYSAVEEVSISSAVPGGLIGDNAYLPEGADSDETFAINNIFTDWHFRETYGLELKEGRWFDEEIPSDSFALVINEAAATALGFDDPIGKRLYTQFGDDEVPRPVIGVVKDFNFQSLHQEIRPLVIQFVQDRRFMMSIRISPENEGVTLEFIEKLWSSFREQEPIHMSFLEDDLAELYQNDEKTASVFSVFSVLAILIAGLGLLGLASFSAIQRTKEVGIRKAMGASTGRVLYTLSREYAWLIIFATLTAWPVGFIAMKRWLQDYPERISLSPEIFIASSVLALVIAAVTVLVRVYRAASRNPVLSLRYE